MSFPFDEPLDEPQDIPQDVPLEVEIARRRELLEYGREVQESQGVPVEDKMQFLRKLDPLRWMEFRDRATEELADSETELDRPLGDYLSWPWRCMDQIIEGVAPGRTTYMGLMSGFGKTTILTSFCEAALAKGQRLYCMPLESTPAEWRKHLVCRRLDLDPGDILTGAYRRWPDWQHIRKRLRQEHARLMDHGDEWANMILSHAKDFSPETVQVALEEAAEVDADWVLIDHVDHIDLHARRSEYQTSVAGNKLMVDLTKELGLRTIASTQLKEREMKQNPLFFHRPPTVDLIRYGDHKHHLADVVLTGCWPLRYRPEVTKEDLLAYRDRKLSIHDVAEPNVICLEVLKHRQRGKNRGRRCFLRVPKGRVQETDQLDFHQPRYV